MATKKPAAKAAAPVVEPVEEIEAVEPVKEEPIDLVAYNNELVTVELFKDNERYKDDVFVGWNGRRWQIQRGVPTQIPRGAAKIIERSNEQSKAAAKMITYLSSQAQEIG